MAAGLATPQDVRLNEPGPICQDSKKRRPFAGEYACLGMRSLRVRFGKSTHLGINSGTKAEMSHGECEDQGASPDCLSARPGVSCRGEVVGPQRAPQAEAPSVGYLGFRARIFLNCCTNCAQMGRDVEPLPFPFSLLPLPLLPQPPKLQADSKSSKTTLPKKCLPKVIGKGPITKNAIYARTTRPHRA